MRPAKRLQNFSIMLVSDTDMLPKNIRRSNFSLFLRFYLFIHERHTERSRDTGRGRSRLTAGSPMRNSIPGPQDHALSRRQTSTTEPPRHPQNFGFKHVLLHLCILSVCNESHHPPLLMTTHSP